MSASHILPGPSTFTGTDRPSTRIPELVHDLRQPLSTIETIAYYLELTVPEEYAEARTLVARLQQLVEEADALLERAITPPGAVTV